MGVVNVTNLVVVGQPVETLIMAMPCRLRAKAMLVRLYDKYTKSLINILLKKRL